MDELLNRFPAWDVDYDDIKLAPTSSCAAGTDGDRGPLMRGRFDSRGDTTGTYGARVVVAAQPWTTEGGR